MKASRLELRQRDVWTVQAQARKDEAAFLSLLLPSVRLARGGSKRTGCVEGEDLDPGPVTSVSSADSRFKRQSPYGLPSPRGHHMAERRAVHSTPQMKLGSQNRDSSRIAVSSQGQQGRREGAGRGRPGGGGSSIQVRVSGCLWSTTSPQTPAPKP